MAPKCKLLYFNFSGLGEPIRYLLSLSKIDFEDERIEVTQWLPIKPDLPFGQVPVLEIDGKKVFQSTAICRYLGKQAGLAGKDDWEALQMDIVVDCISDLRLQHVSYLREADAKLKAEKFEKCLNELNPYFLSRLEKMVVENNGFFVNGKLSWADVYFAAGMVTFETVSKKELLNEYPALKKLRQHVDNLPGIKEYIAKRPKIDNIYITPAK